ncbi:phage tail protein [Lactococcus garvieae]
MMNFLNKDEPNFIFKGKNALIDMGCIIEKELPEVKAQPNIEELTILGRSGSLTEWYGDYKAYDLPIGKISIPYSNLEEVKRWLSGKGKLISHNDPDKYIEAIPNFSTDFNFDNEWGEFYSFELSFRCQPFKRKVNEVPIIMDATSVHFFNPGTENSYPLIEIEGGSGDLTLFFNGGNFKLKNLTSELLTIDTEKGFAKQNNSGVISVGEWPEVVPGENSIYYSGKMTRAKVWMRSVWP